MNDFIARLAGRQLDPTMAIRPNVAALFAPAAYQEVPATASDGTAAAILAITDRGTDRTSAATGDRPAHTARDAVSSTRPSGMPPHRVASGTRPEPLEQAGPPAHRLPLAPPAAAERGTGAPAARRWTEPAGVVEIGFLAPPAPDGRRFPLLPAAPSARPSSGSEAGAARPAPPRSSGAAPAPPPGLDADRAAVGPTIGSARLVTGRWPVTPAGPAQPSAPAVREEPPNVTVTIGRIEVRTTPVPQTPPRQHPDRRPALSLGDYLDRRHGSSRQ
jgi:hypothetical protein